MYDVENPKLKSKNVGGLLQWALGKGSPKFSAAQRKVIGNNVDTVGRGVIIPDAHQTVDEIGIPVRMAFGIMAPFVERALVKRGYTPIAAMKMVKEQSPQALDILQETMKTHPVIMNRAPTLHKYNMMAFKPHLVQGEAIKVHPSICPGFAADFDGNCVDFDSKIFLEISKSVLDNTSFMRYILDAAEKEAGSFINKGDTNMRIAQDQLVTVFNPDEQDQDSIYMQLKIGNFPKMGVPVKDRNGADVYNVPPGVKVLGCDPVTGASGWYEVSGYTHETGCHTVKVTVGDRDVIVSDNESLAVFDSAEGRLVKVRPDQVDGRLVPVFKKDPRAFGPFGDRDLGWLFGAFLSDGWVAGNSVGYCKVEKCKRDAFVSIMRRYHANFNAIEYAEQSKGDRQKLGSSVKVHLNSKSLVDWWNQWKFVDQEELEKVGRKACAKYIDPLMIQYGSEDFLWGLLSGLLDGDGSFSKNTSTRNPRFGCRFSTSSMKLKDSLLMLCYRLGIRTSTTVTPPRNFSNTAYTICLSTVDVWNSLDKLSCIGARETSIMADWKDNKPAKDDKDLIPVAKAEADALSAVIRSSGPTAALYQGLHTSRQGGSLYMTRQTLLAYTDLLADVAPSLLKRVEASNTLWYPVSCVEDAGERDVFDLLVEDAKVYAVNNGLIVWDTVNIHVPVSDNARKEALDKMLPSRNLMSVSGHDIMNKPEKEYAQGLYIATRMGVAPGGRAQIFSTLEDARDAYRKGAIDVDTPINILNPGK